MFFLYLFAFVVFVYDGRLPYSSTSQNEGHMGGSPGVSRKKIAATIHCNIAIQVGNDLRKQNQLGHCDNNVNFLPLLLPEPTSSQSFGTLVKEDHK